MGLGPNVLNDTKSLMSLLFHSDFIRADILDYGTAFNLTKYLVYEKDHIVWDRLASSIAYIQDMLSDTTLYTTFQVESLILLLWCLDWHSSSSSCQIIIPLTVKHSWNCIKRRQKKSRSNGWHLTLMYIRINSVLAYNLFILLYVLFYDLETI